MNFYLRTYMKPAPAPAKPEPAPASPPKPSHGRKEGDKVNYKDYKGCTIVRIYGDEAEVADLSIPGIGDMVADTPELHGVKLDKCTDHVRASYSRRTSTPR